MYMYMHATCRQRTGTHGELSSVGVKADVNCVLKVDRSGYFRPVLDCRVEGGRGGEGGEGEGGIMKIIQVNEQSQPVFRTKGHSYSCIYTTCT